MKLSYEEMSSLFGIVYNCPPMAKIGEINEVFNSGTHNVLLQFENVDEAKKNLKKMENLKNQKEYDLLVNKVVALKNLPLIFRFLKNKEIQKLENNIKKTDLLLEKNNEKDVKVNYLNKNSLYNVDVPNIVKLGDVFFVVVSTKNVLSKGIYRAVVTETTYISPGYGNGSYKFIGVLQIETENKKYNFKFKVEDNHFTSCYAHHHLFLNDDEAVKLLKKVMNKNNYVEKFVNKEFFI